MISGARYSGVPQKEFAPDVCWGGSVFDSIRFGLVWFGFRAKDKKGLLSSVRRETTIGKTKQEPAITSQLKDG